MITKEILGDFARMAMGDSRIHKIIDSYPNGRYILSAMLNDIRQEDRIGDGFPSGTHYQRELTRKLMASHRTVTMIGEILGQAVTVAGEKAADKEAEYWKYVREIAGVKPHQQIKINCKKRTIEIKETGDG